MPTARTPRASWPPPRPRSAPAAAAGRRCARHWDALLGATTVQHARPAVRRAGQPLAAVPDGVVPAVGQGRLLPGRRRHRLSRPVAGRDGAGLGRAGDAARADPARRVAPVRRRRRAALVARAGRRRRAHAFLRRPAVAAATPARTTCAPPATPRCSTSACPSSKAPPIPEGAEDAYYTPTRQRAAGVGLRTRRARHRPQPARRRARPAADGQRRLERRHEPRRPSKGAANRCGWAGSCAALVADFAPLARARGDADARAALGAAPRRAGRRR